MQQIEVFLIYIMIFCHILDDFTLQGMLAKFKQKKYWEEVAPDKKYRYDYIVSLIIHSISWTFMIQLAPAIYLIYTNNFNIAEYSLMYLFNVTLHAVVDNEKANKLKISLLHDQLMHLVQILVTWTIMIFL